MEALFYYCLKDNLLGYGDKENTGCWLLDTG